MSSQMLKDLVRLRLKTPNKMLWQHLADNADLFAEALAPLAGAARAARQVQQVRLIVTVHSAHPAVNVCHIVAQRLDIPAFPGSVTVEVAP